MRLDTFSTGDFERGRSAMTESIWQVTSFLLVASFWPGSRWRVSLLRLFGATIAQGVNIKPFVKIKFPWRLTVGAHSWIGEGVWIDNLAPVTISDNACVSQGAYLCTGSHDWTKESFDLITKPISIGSGAWVGAMARVAPGVTIGKGAILTMGSVATGDLDPDMVYSGNPAIALRIRKSAPKP